METYQSKINQKNLYYKLCMKLHPNFKTIEVLIFSLPFKDNFYLYNSSKYLHMVYWSVKVFWEVFRSESEGFFVADIPFPLAGSDWGEE